MQRANWMCGTAVLALIALAAVCGPETGAAYAQEPTATVQAPAASAAGSDSMFRAWLAIAIAASVGLPCLGAGYAVGRVGAAALGAISERPELAGRCLLYVALAEGIAIYGLPVAILLWLKL